MRSESHVATSQRIIITRADGTVEDYGVIGYWHRNPLRRLAWRVSRIVWRMKYRGGWRNG